MSTVLDDVTTESIDAAHIQSRFDDWESVWTGSTLRSALRAGYPA
ncbi:MAG: hypothetical protein OXF11_02120 [Deltaproteobacteria bacterium]|nr:hypothetical protein [Deltaproteobacteria bacterium]